MSSTLQLGYRRKVQQVYRIAGNFREIQFLLIGHLQRFRDLIFTDGFSGIENVRLGHLFHGFWIPRKFPAIRYI